MCERGRTWKSGRAGDRTESDGGWLSTTLALALIYFGTSASLYTLALWAPLIIRQYGFGSFETGLIAGIPSVLAVVAMILWVKHSDRTEERTWHVVIPCVVTCLGFVFVGQATTALMVILALVIQSGLHPPPVSRPMARAAREEGIHKKSR